MLKIKKMNKITSIQESEKDRFLKDGWGVQLKDGTFEYLDNNDLKEAKTMIKKLESELKNIKNKNTENTETKNLKEFKKVKKQLDQASAFITEIFAKLQTKDANEFITKLNVLIETVKKQDAEKQDTAQGSK